MTYRTDIEHHRLYPWTSLMAAPYSCDATGTNDCASSIEDIKTNQANIGTIYVPHGTFLIGTNLTIPATMSLKREMGGVLSIATGVTLTINGPVELGFDQAFSCTGTGKVVFGSNVPVVYPEWWGAAGDGSTDDFAALQACFTAAPQGSTIQLQGKAYYNTAGATGLVMPQVHGITLQGKGREVTEIVCNRTGVESAGLYCGYDPIGTLYSLTIRDLTVRGRDDDTNLPHSAIYFPGVGTYTTYDFHLINCELTKTDVFGLRGRGSWTSERMLIQNNKIHDIGASLAHGTYGCGFLIQNGNNWVFKDNEFSDLYDPTLTSQTCNWFAVNMGSGQQPKYITFDNNKFWGDNARMGCTGVKHISFVNNKFYGVFYISFREYVDFRIDGNLFWRCNYIALGSQVTETFDSVGGSFSNNVYYGGYETVGYGTKNHCLQILDDTSDVIIANNYFYNLNDDNASLERIIFGECSKILVIGNYFEGKDALWYQKKGDDIQFINNTFITASDDEGHGTGKIESTAGNYKFVGNVFKGFSKSIYCTKTSQSGDIFLNNILSHPPTGNLTSFPHTGTATLVAGTITVTFPVAVTSADYGVTVTLESAVDETLYVDNIATTGFDITSSNGASTADVRYVVNSEYGNL